VTVSSDLYAVGSHCVVYELPHQSQFTNTMVQHRHTPHLVIFRCKLVETFLNNVISVEILDEHYNMKAECKNNRMNLSVVSMISLRSTVSLEDKNPLKATCLASGGQEINHFLCCARTVHVQRNVNEILSDGLANDVSLIICGELEELLAQIVAKGVSHEVRKMTKCFAEDHVPVFRNTFLELLLQVATAVLVFAKCGYFALKVFKACASETVHYINGK
jgi:hypothetical protein